MMNPTGESESDALRLDFDRRLMLQFRGFAVTSDAGLLAYRELDEVLGLTAMASDVLADARTGKNRHALAGLFRQSVFGRLAGYEDVNDAERLRVVPSCPMSAPAWASIGLGRLRLCLICYTCPIYFLKNENQRGKCSDSASFFRGGTRAETGGTTAGNPVIGAGGCWATYSKPSHPKTLTPLSFTSQCNVPVDPANPPAGPLGLGP
jgi:hypothetical protein